MYGPSEKETLRQENKLLSLWQKGARKESLP